MSMRVALVTGEFPPMEGGVGAYTQEIAKALQQRGHELHIITSRQARPPVERAPARSVGEVWRQVGDAREPIDIGYAQLHARARRWGWPDIGVVADIVERFEPDVVNIQYQPAAYNMRSPAINFAPWRLRGMSCPVVTFHDLRYPYLFPKAGRLRTTVVERMARSAAGVITTNPEDTQVLAELGIEPLREIPIGSNISPYFPNEIELQSVNETLGLPKDALLLGYFGFLNETKGADILIKALTRLPKRVHLVFIGGRTGSSDSVNNQLFERQIQQLITASRLQERVHWSGYLSDVRVSAFLCAADLIVMPYRDGVSLRRGTLMAALAHKRPLLSTHPVTPNPDLRHGENIWLVPPDDSQALATGIQTLLEDEGLRERLGEAAGELAQKFSWSRIAEATESFFEELLQQHKVGP